MGGTSDTHTVVDDHSNGASQSAVTVSVVIPTYNAGSQLADQLDAMTRQDFNGSWEVVLADNGSTDGSLSGLERFAAHLDLRVVDASERRGPSFARNFGAAEARGDWLAFCDADDLVAPEWLRKLYAARDGGDMIAGVYEVDRLNTRAATRARAGFEIWEDLPRGPADFLPYAPSGNFMIRREDYLALGGFDETVPGPGGEDVDLSWRVQLAGKHLVLAKDAVVHYRFRDTPRGVYRQVRGYKVAEAELYARYRHLGMQPQSMARLSGRVWWLVSRLPYIGMTDHRLRWFAVAGEVMGNVRGRLLTRKLDRRQEPA